MESMGLKAWEYFISAIIRPYNRNTIFVVIFQELKLSGKVIHGIYKACNKSRRSRELTLRLPPQISLIQLLDTVRMGLFRTIPSAQSPQNLNNQLSCTGWVHTEVICSDDKAERKCKSMLEKSSVISSWAIWLEFSSGWKFCSYALNCSK